VEHENEHLDIREKLLRLPKLQADENFLKRLQIQIDILESEEKTRDVVVKGSASSYFKNLFGARLVPALGISSVVIAAFLVYFLLADKKDAVVTNMTGNKNTETVITPEKPGITNNNSAPTNENKDLAKTEEPGSESETSNDINKKTTDRNTESYGTMPKVKDEITQQTFTEEKIVTPSSDIKSNTGIDIEQQNGRLATTPPQGEITAKKNETEKKQENTSEQKKESTKSANPITSTDSEKTIIEGGRGNTDAKSPKANIKPKKKTVDGIIDINKSVLESLRDKLK
jgi:hypothetical protein